MVNSTDDTDDGVCDVHHCSLHEALTPAEAAGADTITFSLLPTDLWYHPQTGAWTILPTKVYIVPLDTAVDGTI